MTGCRTTQRRMQLGAVLAALRMDSLARSPRSSIGGALYKGRCSSPRRASSMRPEVGHRRSWSVPRPVVRFVWEAVSWPTFFAGPKKGSKETASNANLSTGRGTAQDLLWPTSARIELAPRGSNSAFCTSHLPLTHRGELARVSPREQPALQRRHAMHRRMP